MDNLTWLPYTLYTCRRGSSCLSQQTVDFVVQMISWQHGGKPWTKLACTANYMLFFDDSLKFCGSWTNWFHMCAILSLISGFRSCVRDLIWDFVCLSRNSIDHIVKWRANVTKRYMSLLHCGSPANGGLKHTCACRKIEVERMETHLDEIPHGLFRSSDKWFRRECPSLVSRNRSRILMKNWLTAYGLGEKTPEKLCISFPVFVWDLKNRNQFTIFNWQEISRVGWKRNDSKIERASGLKILWLRFRFIFHGEKMVLYGVTWYEEISSVEWKIKKKLWIERNSIVVSFPPFSLSLTLKWNWKRNSPSESGLLQQPVPMMNIELPSRKMMNIVTK